MAESSKTLDVGLDGHTVCPTAPRQILFQEYVRTVTEQHER